MSSTDEIEPAVEPDDEGRKTTIKYHDDVEKGVRRERQLRRQSVDSMSIRSMSRRRVDPANLLPIEYRTVSFGVEETQRAEPTKATDDAGVEAEIAALKWHTENVERVYQYLRTSSNGLSTEQVVRKQKEVGKNVMSTPPSRWLIKTFLYLFGGFGSVLFVASILVFVSWKPLGQPPVIANLALGIVLAMVWVLQATFSFWQDWSTSRVMSSIKNMLPSECMVIRDGKQELISSVEIVPGDILFIRNGDKLPADVRFIDVSMDSKFDRSILTGEAFPVRATVDSTDDNFLETNCIGLAGTHCVMGNATGVVVLTGNNSVFGRLAKLTSSPNTGLTNLEREIYYFVGTIVCIMIVMILLVIIIWSTWLRKEHPNFINVPTLIVDCVSVAVAFIPEGLPIAVTATLTITASIMKKNKILCKSLKTVETLGSVSTICSDKTGTLTKNKMTVTDFMVGRKVISSTDLVRILGSASLDTGFSFNALVEFAQISALCNEGEFDAATKHLPIEERKVFGNVTDQAILRFADQIQPVSDTRNDWVSVHKVPFNSKNKFMINIVRQSNTLSEETKVKRDLFLIIKGAPDWILSRCTHFRTALGQTESLTDEDRTYFDNIKDDWSRKAKRVLVMAKKTLPAAVADLPQNSVEFDEEILRQSASGLELIGFVGIVDQMRDEIPAVIRTLRGAGIKIHMVTGDFQLTAQAIAKDCGIITQPDELIDDVSALQLAPDKRIGEEGLRSIVLSGSEMMSLDDEQWDVLSNYDEIVFARTTPEQKLKIVKELQFRDEVVGMTGDGVNDAPSLKAADIGIAMGSGSDVAIEAADMVLLDSFAAIVEAVRYGRVVFENLKKTICYLLPAGSFSEFWPVMTSVAFGMPQILSSFLMIIICCCTDCAAAIALAYEKPEADVLLRKPRNTKKDHLVNWKLILYAYGFIGLLETLSSFSMGYWYADRTGVPFGKLWFGFGAVPDNVSSGDYTAILNTSSSIYFINLVVMQWFTLMAIRTSRQSILSHPPLLRKATQNWLLFPAIIFSLLISVFFLYPSKFNEVLGTSPIPAAHWFLPMGFGVGIILLDEARKYFVRHYPKGFMARLAW